MTDIIAKKRDKKELSDEEIRFFVSGVTDCTIPDYQISALLMSIVLNGMTDAETLSLTLAMAGSGDMLDLSALGDKTVDKHSTGGVGDKTTLVVAPVAAALGCTVAKMSGRGLGHTGGTVDKFESITGYKADLSEQEFTDIAKKTGMCIIGKSSNFAPADKRIYALRDVTATVESIPLIASSVMSKKLAAGAKNIVLDVKYGSGAFMKTAEDAEKLADKMVKIGKDAGRNTVAIITDMDTPLGVTVGNSLEVKEACDVLKGGGSADLKEICVALASYMYSLCFNKSIEECKAEVNRVIDDGSAFKALIDTVRLQGGDADLLTGAKEFPTPKFKTELTAERDGFITSMDCETVGKAARLCGAGRETVAEKIDPCAGIVLHKKMGDYVRSGEILATLYGEKQKALNGVQLLKTAYNFGETRPVCNKLIYKIIT